MAGAVADGGEVWCSVSEDPGAALRERGAGGGGTAGGGIVASGTVGDKLDHSEWGIPAAYGQAAGSSATKTNPFSLVSAELAAVASRLRGSVASEAPPLATAASYFFREGAEGKRFRPTVLLLMASALNPLGAPALRSEGALEVRRRQQRIAEITEMIHVASLLHDDVLDDAAERRSQPSVNQKMGNKLAILGGDFLLARASVALAQLRDPDVIAMLARVIEHLVTGEVMQMTASEDRRCSLEYYKRKTYYKTASLLANSSRAVAALGGLGEAASQNAYAYGKHVGLAFQFVDDHLDFTASSALLGKPAGNDLRQGIATAPVLFAAEEHKELLPLIRRKFAQPGDAERALELVGRSEGLERTQQLAEDHAAVAVEALKRLPLPEGEGVGSVVRTEAALAREALVEITRRVLERKR